MTIFFRVDCGGPYGLGHAMRCRTLALAIHVQAPDVPLVFVTTPPALRSIVEEINDRDWRLMLCGYGEADCLSFIRNEAISGDSLVVDMPQHWNSVTRLPSLRQHLHVVRLDAPWADPETCDLLVLPGMHHSAETVEQLDAAFGERLLMGAEYVLLRREILAPSHGSFMHDPWIIFWAGGSDPDHALDLLLTITGTLEQRLPGTQRIFCMGSQSVPWSIPPLSPHVWITGCDISYIREASIFVTLWGMTAYEALALGTPTLTIARTEAEAEDAASLEAATDGAVQSLGTLAGLMRETLCDRLVALWQDTKERKRMHYASAGLVDGKGAERVALAVLALAKK